MHKARGGTAIERFGCGLGNMKYRAYQIVLAISYRSSKFNGYTLPTLLVMNPTLRNIWNSIKLGLFPIQEDLVCEGIGLSKYEPYTQKGHLHPT